MPSPVPMSGAHPRLYGIPVKTSSLVPPDQIWLISDSATKDLSKMWDRVLRDPIKPRSVITEIFAECRRRIAMECPLISPPEWYGVESISAREWYGKMQLIMRGNWIYPGPRALDVNS